MIIKRLLALQFILLFGLGSLFLLPTQPKRPDPGVNMELPDFVGDWFGVDAEVSEKELTALGRETRFSRKSYSNGRGDNIYVSIVLAGEDMNTSIHRPERCLPAQGYTMMESSRRKVPLAQPLTVTRLHNKRPISLQDGQTLTEYSLDYYWFIGSSETTASHIQRNLIDVRDRLLKGCNQPWAFVTVISRVTKGWQKFGRDEAQTDAVINDFLKQLVPLIQKKEVVNR